MLLANETYNIVCCLFFVVTVVIRSHFIVIQLAINSGKFIEMNRMKSSFICMKYNCCAVMKNPCIRLKLINMLSVSFCICVGHHFRAYYVLL